MKQILLILLFLPAFTQGQIISTFAGGGSTIGEGVPATASILVANAAGRFDNNGNYYFSQTANCTVRKISSSGIITTVAGINGFIGFSGDNGPATTAKLMYPEGVVCDTVGNLFIADHQNYRIREINFSTGIISTFAGSGGTGSSGDGGPATAASFSPADVCLDNRNNLYICDNTYDVVRKINTLGIISTVAGTGVRGYNGDNIPATSARLYEPGWILVDNIGNLYIADAGNDRIRKVDTFGIITTIAGTGMGAYSGDGIPATATHMKPLCFAFDEDENIYAGDSNQRVLFIDHLSGIVHTVAGTGIAGYNGDGIPATSAQLYNPNGTSLDGCGNIYINDAVNSRIRKVSLNPYCWPESVQSITTTSYVINIYPNPATTFLSITSQDKITSIAITNLLGQTIYTQSYNSPQVQIDVANLPKGIYFIKINGTDVRKFVKE